MLYEYLLKLLEDVRKRVETAAANSNPNTDESVTLNVHIIGPYDSENLQDMIKESSENKPLLNEKLSVHHYSPTATMPENRLLMDQVPNSLPTMPDSDKLVDKEHHLIYDSNLIPYEDLREYFQKNGNLDFIRITPDQNHFADAIKDELARRNITEKNSSLLLISEWDTLYGSRFPDIVAAKFVKKTPLDVEQSPPLNTCSNNK